jgi:uncharacterized protein (TIGR02246 family)
MTSNSITVSLIAAQIREANDQFETTYARGDAPGMASLYTSEGMLLPTGVEPVKGRQAISHFWQLVMDMGVKNAKLDSVEVEQHGDTAIEVGQYLLSDAEGKRIDQGKYIVIWKKQDGQWKLHKDIWNTSLATS